MNNDYPPTPELDKMKAVKDKSQICGEFLLWLEEQGHITDLYTSTEQTLAKFFGIDLKKVEKERRAALAWVRKEQSSLHAK